MAGIAGCFSADRASLRRVPGMLELLGPRVGNPDTHQAGSQDWASLAASSDCAVFQDDQHLVVVDGRLDHLQSLAKELGTPADPALVVLAAWRRWRAAAVDHLAGDYVLVIMTPVELFCARDPVGSKPFYYHDGPSGFFFASEALPIGRLLQLPVNESRIADSLVFPLEHVDKTSTFFTGVNRLPPGNTLVMQHGGGTKVQSFWQASSVTEAADLSLDDAIAEFKTLLQRAVDCRIEDESAALSLSGGVDSGTILGFAGRRVRAVSTLAPPGEDCEDSKHIKALTAHVGCPTFFWELETAKEMNSQFTRQLEHLSEPFDYYMLQSMLMSRTASQAGCSVILDGVEGDLVYSLGTSYPSTLLRAGKIRRGLREAKGVHRHAFKGEGSLLGWYYMCLRQIGLPRPLRFLRRLKQPFTDGKLEKPDQTLIHPEFAAQTRVLEKLAGSAEQLYGGYPDLTEYHCRSVEHPAIVAALERYDRVVSWHGVEPRHPLLDLKLIEFALSVPWHMKSRDGWSKYLLRKAGAGLIPHEVSWREGRDENAWRFLDQFVDDQREYMRESVITNVGLLEHYIDPTRLRALHDADIQQLFVLGSWLRRVLEKAF